MTPEQLLERIEQLSAGIPPGYWDHKDYRRRADEVYDLKRRYAQLKERDDEIARLKDHSEWLEKVALRMYRHLEELGVDHFTLTALAVALKIGKTDDEG